MTPRQMVATSALVIVALFLLAFEVPRALLFGWLMFLARVLPRVAPDGSTVGFSLLALTLFTLGLHGLGRSLWARPPVGEQGTRPPAWRWRWSLAIVLTIFVMFAAGLAFLGVAHQAGWLLTAPEPLVGPGVGGWGYPSVNNMKHISLGLSNHEDAYGALPPGGSFSKDGVMLHGWETHSLPFIGYYSREIDLTRPWNHPANARPLKSVVPLFLNPGFRTADVVDAQGFGLNHYAANSHLLGANTRTSLKDISDGNAATILIGEVNTAFRPWARPLNCRDPAEGINTSPRGFGGPWSSGGATFMMADGSSRFVSDRVSREVLKALATPRGGEDIED
jgi:hypothetical protein